LSKLLKWTIGLTLVAAIGVTTYSLVAPQGDGSAGARRASSKGGGFKGRGRPPADAVPVLAALAQKSDVPLYLDGLGSARALNTVIVQPMVDGRLVSIDFREGQDVKSGDLLARIEPAVYAAQLAQAVARKAQNEAQLADARRELDRVSRVGPIATLQKSVDTARAKVAQFEALVKADQATIDLAQTNLDYTRITAPIDGRTGIRMVDVGNVVRAAGTSGIVTITQVQPIAVLFNLPQQQLARINAAVQARGAGGELAAEALGSNGNVIIERGVLRVVDNQVDQTTGTIRLKAEFPNAGLALWPGQFVNVRIKVDTLRDAVSVPAASVQQGPNGSFVYVVDADGKAKVRPVRIATQDERIATLASGVAAGEQVVTSSFSRLRDDTAVSVTLQPAEGPQASTPGTAGQSGTTAGSGDAPAARAKGGGEGKRGPRRDVTEGKDAAAGTPRGTAGATGPSAGGAVSQ
jgi:multidrug efflux system membrane fusion protein